MTTKTQQPGMKASSEYIVTLINNPQSDPVNKIDPPTRPPPLLLTEDKIYLNKINSCNRSLFEKNVLRLLLQIPCGSYTTYGQLAAVLHSSPRAVGNALRRNPFSPQVPCHRVVATQRTIGGFKGRVGEETDEVREKRTLLKREGVKFDGRGRVLGSPFEGWRRPR
ncbi:Methylated-DNA--protein-cysteine methyltransferase [Ceratocystis platani]|uniref:Methylated-DNA--protein-cysteine methyltransferase n=1 Tax=Ceratocystis fimbriata f. sp. platani TaxID=88771 RepID=A0A0F8D9I6_CERFI|nr:Methylated-DNA--protein-cysteine methyltransferase [Ceratocystis platani]